MSIFVELKRRNVFRVGIAYVVASWVLLQVADLIFDAINAPDWVLQALLVVVALGFVVAVVVAWAYELTPEGIRRESEIEPGQSIIAQTGRKLDRIIIVFLVLAVAVLLFERSMISRQEAASGSDSMSAIEPDPIKSPGPEAPPSQASVAVLPFANMSPDPDNEYFSDGISEELLNLLVRVEGLRVPSRTSSFAFKGMNTDIREIARQLEVSHILEGSVRKAGNRVRVTAQLIDVSTDTHLWSDTYDRELEDIFTIQDEIAGRIVNALKDVLGAGTVISSRASHKPTQDLVAYQEYLRARHLFMQRGVESLRTSLNLLQSAVNRDPEFTEAWAQLSQTAVTLEGWDSGNELDALEIAAEAGLRALQLDPDSANAMAGLGMTYYYQLRWNESLDLFEAAEPLSADSTPIYWYGSVLSGAGYVTEAREKFLAAETIDPVYTMLQYWLGLSDMAHGQLDGPRARFRRIAEGNNPNGSYGMLLLELVEGNPEAAAHWLDRNWKISTADSSAATSSENLDLLMAALEDPALRDRAVTAALVERYYSIAAYFGAYAEIIRSVQDLLAAGKRVEVANDVGVLFWTPAFAPMRQLPEFKDLARDLGLVDLWKTRGWPDHCRPVGDQDFECE